MFFDDSVSQSQKETLPQLFGEIDEGEDVDDAPTTTTS